VLDRVVPDGDLAADHVGERGGPLVGSPEAHDDARAGRHTTVAAPAVVAGHGVALGALLDLLRSAVASVGPTVGQETIDGRLVELRAFGLAIGPLVPVEAQPPQRRLDA